MEFESWVQQFSECVRTRYIVDALINLGLRLLVPEFVSCSKPVCLLRGFQILAILVSGSARELRYDWRGQQNVRPSTPHQHQHHKHKPATSISSD